MPIEKSLEPKNGPKGEPMVFRFTRETVEQLNALAIYSGRTLVGVIETLVSDAFTELKAKDSIGIERSRDEGLQEVKRRRAKRKKVLNKA